MKIPINKLVNNTGQIDGVPANPRQINKDDYAKLLKSLQEDPDFLEHKPLHVVEHGDKYVVLGGNQRLKALRELKYKDVPVTIYDPETPVEVLKSRVIKDNSAFGSYDFEMLGNEWDDMPLTDWGIDLPEDWLKEEPEVEEDEAPEVDESEPPKSKLGEVYQLGQHRVICGSATSTDDYSKLMGDIRADLIFTDPPYNMAYTGSATKRRKAIENDKIENFQEFINDTLATLSSFAKPSAPYYVFTCEEEIKTVKNGFIASGLRPHQTLIWKKQRIGFGGTNVDTGATNRKLGSDMGRAVTGGGLHGKDLSKADVSVNIYAHLKAQETGEEVNICCAIGDEKVDGKDYTDIIEVAKSYIDKLGGFERLAEWGIV